MEIPSIKRMIFNRFTRAKKHTEGEERHYFLITSSGQMATFWLASQLNKHPNIFCSHSYDKPAWGATGSPLRGKDGERQRAVIKERLGSLSLQDFFSENAETTPKKYVGNVHAYNIENALALVKKEKLQNVKMVNLIRHPIARINSFVNCMKNEWFDFGYVEHLTFIPKIYLEYGRQLVTDSLGANSLKEFDDSLDKQFFVAAAILERGTAYQVKTAETNNIPNIKYEDITSCKDTMDRLVRHIGNDALIDQYDWFNQDIAYKKLNSHSKASYDTIQSIYDQWEPWKKEVYKQLITDNVFKLYTNSYYDFIVK
jgi:hypothetical protein